MTRVPWASARTLESCQKTTWSTASGPSGRGTKSCSTFVNNKLIHDITRDPHSTPTAGSVPGCLLSTSHTLPFVIHEAQRGKAPCPRSHGLNGRGRIQAHGCWILTPEPTPRPPPLCFYSDLAPESPMIPGGRQSKCYSPLTGRKTEPRSPCPPVPSPRALGPGLLTCCPLAGRDHHGSRRCGVQGTQRLSSGPSPPRPGRSAGTWCGC